MKRFMTLIAICCMGVFGFSQVALAGHTGVPTDHDLGTGVGCSALEGLDATSIIADDYFVGRIGRNGVDGVNRGGRDVDDFDSDDLTDSMEECINDSLHGYCSAVFNADGSNITLAPLAYAGRNEQQRWFMVTFDGTGCDTSQCSDHDDNDSDFTRDFGGAHGDPADVGCDDYDDNDELPSAI